MRKIFTLVMLCLFAVGVSAETRSWDFTSWSEETLANLEAESAIYNAYYDSCGSVMTGTLWRSYEKEATYADYDGFYFYGTEITSEEGEEITANGEVIAELAGLYFTKVGANNFAIAVDYDSTSLGTYQGGAYLWLGGASSKSTNNSFIIPDVAAGSTITIGIESHKNSDGRGVILTIDDESVLDLSSTKTYTESSVTLETTETKDVEVYNTNGCHLYFITVEEPSAYPVDATVVWAMNDDSNLDAYTAEPEDGFSSVTFDLGDATASGTRTHTEEAYSSQKLVNITPATGATDLLKWSVTPADGLYFTPTKVSGWIGRNGTDVSNGVTVYGIADSDTITLGNYTAARTNKTQDEDAYGTNDNYTGYYEIELNAAQMYALATNGTFTLAATIGTGTNKSAAFGEVTISGTLDDEEPSYEADITLSYVSPEEETAVTELSEVIIGVAEDYADYTINTGAVDEILVYSKLGGIFGVSSVSQNDDNNIVIALDSTFTEDIYITVTVPEGLVCTEGHINEATAFNYQVSESAGTTYEFTLTPADGETVSQLDSIMVYCEAASVLSTNWNHFNGDVLITDEAGETVASITTTYEPYDWTNYVGYNYMYLVLEEPITTAGTYTLTIPAGAIYINDAASENTEEITATYIVDGSAEEEEETEAVYDEDGYLFVEGIYFEDSETYDENWEVDSNVTLSQVERSDGVYYAQLYAYNTTNASYFSANNETFTTAEQWKIAFDFGAGSGNSSTGYVYFTDVNTDTLFSITIGSYETSPSVYDASGNSIGTISIDNRCTAPTIWNHFIVTGDETNGVCVAVTDEDGTSLIEATKVADFANFSAINFTPGKYMVYFGLDEVEMYIMESESDGEDSGINTINANAVTDATINVYNLSGMKVMSTTNAADINSLSKGLYIINGKKVVIK